MISDQNCMTQSSMQLPLYYIHFEITQQEKIKVNIFIYQGTGLLENKAGKMFPQGVSFVLFCF